MATADLLHLMKAGRILQYRQQNVALVSAPEGTEFEITYADRWLAPGTDVGVGDGAIVVLGDSPYRMVDPVRFATITRADRTTGALEITIKVGPWPILTDDVSPAYPVPDRPIDSSSPWFVWRGAGTSLRNPQSDEEAHDAWRAVVDRLRGNQFYAESRFARLVRVLDPHGHEVRGRGMVLGETATAVIETRCVSDGDHVHSVLVDTEPPGAVAGGVREERVDDVGRLHVPMRPLASGSHQVSLSFVPDPLLSTRLSFEISARVAATPDPDHRPISASPRSSPAGPGTDSAHVQALAQRLRRIEAIEPEQWLELLVDHVLPLAPVDAVLRSMVAEAAFDLGDDRLVVEMLDDPARFRTGDAFRALIAGLRYGARTDVAGFLREIDLGTERNIAMLAKALPALPDGAVRDMAEAILDELAGKEVLDRLLPSVFFRLHDDLALRVAQECVAADPDAWLDRTLRRWPDPSRIPREALDEILNWDIRDAALAPYLREAIEIRVASDDLVGVTELMSRAEGLLPRAEMIRLRMATALLCFKGDAELSKRMLLEVVDRAAGLADPDVWVDLAFTLREFWPPEADADVDAAIQRLGLTLSSSEVFQQWREMKFEGESAALRRETNGRILHVVGAWRPIWADVLAEDLGLRNLRWHESERSDSPPMDWAVAVDPERDLVVVLWTHCGHSTLRSLDAAGVAYLSAVFGHASILAALRAGLLSK